MATIERTVYDALTQDANSTIKRIPGSVGIKEGVIDIFFPDVRNGRVKYTIIDSADKRTDVDVDAPMVTPEGISITLLSEGITPGHQLARVETTGSVGLFRLTVTLEDWTTADVDALATQVAANTAAIGNVYTKAEADAKFEPKASV